MKSFLYLHGRDLAAMRRFYGEIIGLDEIYADDRTVGFRSGTVQITCAVADNATPPSTWSSQLGWEGGLGAEPSWGFEFDADAFIEAVERATMHDLEAFWPQPHWVGYWSFPVRDPGGNTVEISSPDRNAWPPPGDS